MSPKRKRGGPGEGGGLDEGALAQGPELSSLEALRRSYLASSLAQLEARFEEMRAAYGPSELEALEMLAHRFRGSGASYGYPEVSERAGALEDLLAEGDAQELSRGEGRRLLLARFEALVEVFRRLEGGAAAQRR